MRCLESVRRTVPEGTEIVVLDNHSSDGLKEDLARLEAPFRVILSERRRHYAANANEAVRAARGEFVCLLNNDVLLVPGWLEPMLALMRTAPDAGLVGNIQINPRNGRIDHAGMFFAPDGMPRHARKNRRRLPKERWLEWGCVTSACMLLKRSVFLAYGGYDEAYRNSCEDIDLAVRMRRDGYRHYVSNEVPVFHHVGSSPERHDWDDSNQRRFFDQWGGLGCQWARSEWAMEYFRRYAEQWWKLSPAECLRAIWYLLTEEQWRGARGAPIAGGPRKCAEFRIPDHPSGA